MRVPADHLLGERGRGYAQFLATLDDGRVAIAALAVGCIQGCLDLCVQYAGERTTFGVPIGTKQGVAFQVADLAVMAQAGRALTYQAAAMKDAGASAKEFKQAASIAKLYTSEAAVTATRIATQVFGGYGFMEEYPVAQVLPRREDPRDRRGDLRGAAHAHRAGPGSPGRVGTA